MTFSHIKLRTNTNLRATALLLCVLLAALAAGAMMPVDDDRLYLEHADHLRADQYVVPGAQRLSGNVVFRHKGMRLYCDSANYYEPSNSFEAFGHVKMLQGDTLSLTGERLYYDGSSMLCQVRERVVMKHRGQVLRTDSLNYDRAQSYAYYFEGGTLQDGRTTLVSDWGEYHTDTRQSLFNYNVTLTEPKYRLVTDTLHYDTQTKWANALGASNIYSGDSRIYTENGFFNTTSEQIKLFDRSQVYDKATSMTGDSIFYDKVSGDMNATGSVRYEDRDQHLIFLGDYCHYNEQTGESVAYGEALAKDYSNVSDTLFLHADTLRTYTYNLETDSVYRVMHGYMHARAFRSDVQAVADSLVFNGQLRRLALYRDPIVWSDNRQVVGEEINVFVNDSTIDSVYVERQALLVERVDSVHFNQVAGALMRSYFQEGEMRENWVDGNVCVVFFPLEKDSSLLYQNYLESSRLRVNIEKRKMQRIWAAPSPDGCMYPLGMAPPGRNRLPGFAWFDYVRPRDKYDLFEWRPKQEGAQLKPSVRKHAPVQTLPKAGETAIPKSQTEDTSSQGTEAENKAEKNEGASQPSEETNPASKDTLSQ